MLKTTAGGQTAYAGFEKKLTGRVPDDSVIPDSIFKGIRLMLAGGAITALSALLFLGDLIVHRNVLSNSNQKLTGGQLAGDIVGTLVSTLIVVAIWVLMARFNRQGAKWARILASVFAVVSTLSTYSLVNSVKSGDRFTWEDIAYIALTIILWVIGVLSIAMIWRPDANVYYNAQSSRR